MLAIQALLTVVALMGDVPSANDAPKGSPGIASTFAGQTLLLSNNGQTSLAGAQLVMDKDESGSGFNGYNYLTFSGHSGAHNFGPAAFFQMQSSRGTRLARSSTLSGDWLFGWSMYGYDAADNFPQFALGAQINVTAEGDWTVAGVHPSRMEIVAGDILLENPDSSVYLRGHDHITELAFISAGCTDSYSGVMLCADNNSHSLRIGYLGGPASTVIRAVDTFTSVAGGAAPASGGGTANFLRADATWAAPAGGFIAFTKKTSGTTHVLQATTTSAIVLACGAGGGGGGAGTGAASAAAAGGGASGDCTMKRYTGLTGGATMTTTEGTAGTAGANTGGTGGTGGDTTFTDGTTLITGKGGLGGLGEAAGTVAGYSDGGSSPAGTNGDTTGGANGTNGARATGLIGIAGSGGSCPYALGTGGVGSSTAGVGATATGLCSGGAGGLVLNNSAAVTGGVATGGVNLIWEYQ